MTSEFVNGIGNRAEDSDKFPEKPTDVENGVATTGWSVGGCGRQCP